MADVPNLLGLDLDALSEALVSVANRARNLAANGDVVALADLLGAVRAAANASRGPQLLMLEVAEALLRALARTDMGKSEIELRRFAMAMPEEADAFLAPLADGGVAGASAIAKLGPWSQRLVEVGVLRALGKERFDLRPSLRTLARDLTEPTAFRMWRRVNAARGIIGLSRMTDEQAAGYLSSEFGTTQQQAELHLRHAPLTPLQGTPHEPAPIRPGREAKVVYRRLPAKTSGKAAEEQLFDKPLASDNAHGRRQDASGASTIAVGAGTQANPWS